MASNETSQEVHIRQMEVDDIPDVYHLGVQLFHSGEFTTLYRTWDAYEVTTNFNQDTELCLVAEDSNERIVGFALGTTYQKERGSWKYGYVSWLGVVPAHQGERVGGRLYLEMERRMRQEGVRMILLDTEESNKAAINFFKSMGFGKPKHQVWMSKVVRRSEENHNSSPKSNRPSRARGSLPSPPPLP